MTDPSAAASSFRAGERLSQYTYAGPPDPRSGYSSTTYYGQPTGQTVPTRSGANPLEMSLCWTLGLRCSNLTDRERRPASFFPATPDVGQAARDARDTVRDYTPGLGVVGDALKFGALGVGAGLVLVLGVLALSR